MFFQVNHPVYDEKLTIICHFRLSENGLDAISSIKFLIDLLS